jgi:FkbM family methyltransferase
MRATVGSEGMVYAFEPQPVLAEYLRQAVRAFSWTNVHVEGTALSSNRGAATLHAPGRGPTPSATVVRPPSEGPVDSYPVGVDTLDGFLAENAPSTPVRLIKCDVEGHELDVFRGAEQTLARHRPVLLFECEARHDPTRLVNDVFGHLQDRGYSGSFFWKGEHRPLEEFEVSLHQVVDRSPYANNFIFEPEEPSVRGEV